MQRTFIATGSRTCLNAHGSTSSRRPSDLTSKTIVRSLSKKPAGTLTGTLLNPKTREARLTAIAKKALQDKYDRNAYNKRYRKMREDKAQARKDRNKEQETKDVANIFRSAHRATPREAMKALKEEWELGPLASRRDIGERAQKLGTLDAGLHELYSLTPTQQESFRRRLGNNVFKVHDRVVVLSGKDKGKIGQILSIDEEKQSARVQNVNKVAVHVPDYMRAHDSDRRTFRVVQRDVRLDQLKLVVSQRDEQTKQIKEIILDQMDLKKVLVEAPGQTAKIEAGKEDLPTDQGEPIKRESDQAYELHDYKWKTLRYIPETKTEIIDHSARYEEHDADEEYGPNDTLLITVEERTYFPQIYDAPMSESSLKEITKKDAKSITRFNTHIEESIRRKAEVQARKQFELEDSIRTPLQELKIELKKVKRSAVRARKVEFNGRPLNRSVDVSKATKAEKTPSLNMMDVIGQAMARHWENNPKLMDDRRKKLLKNIPQQPSAASSVDSRASL